MTNPHRGEFLMNLAGQEIKTKLNLDSIVRIEAALNASIIRTMQKLASTDMRADELITVLHVAIRGGGNDWDKKKVSALVWEAGLVESMKACAEVLSFSLVSSESGNDEAAEV